MMFGVAFNIALFVRLYPYGIDVTLTYLDFGKGFG